MNNPSSTKRDQAAPTTTFAPFAPAANTNFSGAPFVGSRAGAMRSRIISSGGTRFFGAAGVAALVLLAAPLGTDLGAAQSLSFDLVPVASAQATVAEPLTKLPAAAVTDFTGTLSEAELQALNDRAHEVFVTTDILPMVILSDALSGSAEDTARQLVAAFDSNNVALLVVSPANRVVGYAAGADISSSHAENMYQAALSMLKNSDYPGAAEAFINAAESSGGSGDGSGGSGLLWLLGAAGVGGGAFVATRAGAKRKSAKQLAEQTEAARSIKPTERAKLTKLPLQVLTQLANEEIISTDQSIRQAQDDLTLAATEFTPDRLQPFTQALANSRNTLARAMQLSNQFTGGPRTVTEADRTTLVEIISTCGAADDLLEAQQQNFAQLRDVLLTAPSRLENLTQQLVAARVDADRARGYVDSLEDNVRGAVANNPAIADELLADTEATLDHARGLLRRPAGEQDGLVDDIRRAEVSLATVDKLNRAVFDADANYRAALANIGGLETTAKQHLTAAEDLINTGESSRAQATYDSLQQAISAVRTALGSEDHVLTKYQDLMEADATLTHELASTRAAVDDHLLLVSAYDQAMSNAAQLIRAVDSLISTRGSIIGSEARSNLAAAQQLFEQARPLRLSNPAQGESLASRAARKARTAQRRADEDIEHYNSRNSSNGSGLATGYLLGSMMNGGRHSGGFGGGFSGGGFSGGGGGISSGGGHF